VNQLQAYMGASRTDPVEFIAAWRDLKPYQVAVPAETDSLSSEFLFSNLRIALAILENRFRMNPAARGALQPRSPGR
jgi:hypothetical protein